MAKVEFINPQPYSVTLADQRGSRLTIRPQQVFLGEERWYSRFVNPKSIQRHVNVDKNVLAANAAIAKTSHPTAEETKPAAEPTVAEEAAGKAEGDGVLDLDAPAAPVDGSDGGEGGDLYLGQSREEWMATVAGEEFPGTLARGELVGLADFFGVKDTVSGRSAVDYGTSLKETLRL